MASNGENTPTFPCGTIFRASHPSGVRITALVKEDGHIKVLRSNDLTYKSPNWWPGYVENKAVGDFIDIYAKPGWTLTADVRPPKDWWNEAGTEWRRALPPGASHAEIARICQAAYAKAREGWAEYVRRLQALYPVFTAIEKAPEGANVPFRLVAAATPTVAAVVPVLETLNHILESAAQPQPLPQLLMPPARPETVTLTRDQMNYIYTMASGRAITDDVWATVKQIAATS